MFDNIEYNRLNMSCVEFLQDMLQKNKNIRYRDILIQCYYKWIFIFI
jgi:hypothetical protein